MTSDNRDEAIRRHLQPLLERAELYGQCKVSPNVPTSDFRRVTSEYRREQDDFLEWLDTFYRSGRR